MFCRKCGKSIPDDSLFCSYCGETVISEDFEQSNSSQNVHGYCSNCGEPLPDGKISGLCESCIRGVTEEPEKSWYTPGPVKPISIEKRKHRPVAIAILVVIGILCVMAYIGNSIPSSSTAAQPPNTTSGSETASSTPSSSAPEVKSDLEILSSDGVFNSDINAIHITGKIKNNSSKTLSYVQIQFALYDKSGSQVGTALANTNGLEPGNTWSYDAIGMAANVSTFKAINLSGY